ncbi:drug resistance transporter, EmrB/QacA subfamily [Geodermatophilus pulveris]|uniref:Drug resistance transporter, EmrB/QacA subfamily n=1 Tax=Geodermatophilus pulveris TaxID=1564159 RepID=A0A239BV06_9ACTN|nr:DHA2 family efflux MFS transporter permease subunit [Geodermatophilus pulveris]SNS10884.1 drug resistance transporter, EmrB/QacA subfamily [Geodermatophilus pulveris]
MSPATRTRPGAVLAVMCLAVFTVNVDTTIVNVTLPTLVAELGATTRDLQWIVDSYLLVFAALVLAGGSLSDRLGRRALLVAGLAVFGLGNALAAVAGTPGELIAARAFTGIGAAAVFPTTLSILTQVFRERAARARAIGLWGASTGLAVAFGPITGGALLEQFWWGSTFLVKLPIALLALALVLALVPESRDPAAPRIDTAGLVLSALGLGALVYTIIEAPGHGWGSVRTLLGAAVAAGLFAAFVRHERRTSQPMLDLRLFADRRFTAAALAITVAFFALFGFIFLVTQYFQFLRGYGPLETGVRILPVAVCVAIGSVLGSLLVVRLGNKLVVTTGLLSLAVAYAWVSTASDVTGYAEIAGQMVFLGLGMGLTSAPATESIMGAVQTDKAGIGSAVNDATREVGGTLGVAVIGSVFASLYAVQVESLPAGVPAEVVRAAGDSVGAAFTAAAQVPAGPAELVRAAAERGFFDGLAAGCLVASGVALAGAVVAVLALPARPPSGPVVPGGTAGQGVLAADAT